MESGKVSSPHPLKFGSVARSVTKILRLSRPSTTTGGVTAGAGDDEKVDQGKLSQNSGEDSSGDPMDREALVGNLFASISAIKASYAQLQIAQVPFNPELVQSSDKSIVAEFKRISELKKAYQKEQFKPGPAAGGLPPPAIVAQVEEQRSLIKTYQITVSKLEKEVELKDAKILSLESKLIESEKKIPSLETERHSSRSLAALDDLHLSGLNPAHFLLALRFAYKSIRSFVSLMMKEMESARVDLSAAAGYIQPIVLRRKNHLAFVFQSYVCLTMFAELNHKSFDIDGLEHRSTWDRRKFFEEFAELKSLPSSAALSQQVSPARVALAKFFRAKYSKLMQPTAQQRPGGGFQGSREIFAGFLEMARRVWLLHCLFFSFDKEQERPSIFQIGRGSRFSKTYMDSVGDDGDGHGQGTPTVGFTVVPGFRVGQTTIQCKVYLSPNGAVAE